MVGYNGGLLERAGDTVLGEVDGSIINTEWRYQEQV